MLDGWYHQVWAGPASAGLIAMVKGIAYVDRGVEAVVSYGLSFK